LSSSVFVRSDPVGEAKRDEGEGESERVIGIEAGEKQKRWGKMVGERVEGKVGRGMGRRRMLGGDAGRKKRMSWGRG
jgi:hypothetical protein